MTRKNFPFRVELRQKAAVDRQAACAKLTIEQRLAKLDAAGLTAAKERLKLQSRYAQGAQVALDSVAEAKPNKKARKKAKKKTEQPEQA